jgi:RNA polymerase sigma factor (TIGR02999 family)
MLAGMSDVTRMLLAIEQGDQQASNDLLPLVYDELRRLAAVELRREKPGHSLQPTALVHEAYLRLVDQSDEPHWNHRGHFYAAAAQAMRRILVESARRRQAQKRGGDRGRETLKAEHLAVPERAPDLIALDEALTQLAETKPKLAELVSLRYFAGLTMEQAAKALKVPLRSAERDWTYARVWLLTALRDDG